MITDLGHFALRAYDLDASLAFYRKLGIDEAFRRCPHAVDCRRPQAREVVRGFGDGKFSLRANQFRDEWTAFRRRMLRERAHDARGHVERVILHGENGPNHDPDW